MVFKARMRRRIGALPLVGFRSTAIGLALAACAFGAGCSTQKPFWDLFGSREDSSEGQAKTSQTGVYYVGVSDLKLYAEPSFSSSVVATLPLHHKVDRHAIQQGFARVTVEGSAKEGWVENAKLIWRLPARKAGAATEKESAPLPPASPSEPEQVPRPETLADPAPPVQAPAASDEPSVSPNVFDPF